MLENILSHGVRFLSLYIRLLGYFETSEDGLRLIELRDFAVLLGWMWLTFTPMPLGRRFWYASGIRVQICHLSLCIKALFIIDRVLCLVSGSAHKLRIRSLAVKAARHQQCCGWTLGPVHTASRVRYIHCSKTLPIRQATTTLHIIQVLMVSRYMSCKG